MIGARGISPAMSTKEVDDLKQHLERMTTELERTRSELSAARTALENERASHTETRNQHGAERAAQLPAQEQLVGHATANTSSPSFEDLPPEHPLKGGDTLPRVPDVTGPVTAPEVINAPGSPIATMPGSVPQPKR